MAWADNEAKIGTTEYATLKAALDAASSGATVELLKDVSYTDAAGTANLNINKSLTLDGKGHTISGYSTRSGKTQYATIWINLVSPSASNVTVIFKDVKVINPKSGSNTWAIHTRGKIDSVAVVDSYLEANMTPFQIGGSQATKAKITMLNSQLKALSYYCVCSYNPYILKAENCEFNGWNALYFKGVDGSAGSRGSVATLTNCNLNCPNPYDTPTNAFGMFVCEDDGISITLNNCGMHAEQLGNQTQTVFLLSNFASKTRRSQPMTFAITGDNSYINGKLVSYSGWAAGWYNNAPSDAAIPDPCPLSITISGGTYAFNPANQGWLKNQTYETEEELYDESNIGKVTIPAGYEVKEIETQQGEQTTTLYRVRKTITTSYSINQDVEGEGEGQNENTEFIISANETVEQQSTIANYVEVSNDATLTLPAGKELTVKNGLDVTEGAQVVVEAGSTLKVGEGGVTAETVESIVIEANENGSASFLLDPEVIVNTTPNLTVRMTAKQIGRNAEGDFYWHRFALPVAALATWEKEGNLLPADPGYTVQYPTYVYAWDYENNAWDNIAPGAMNPLQGYTLTLASDYIHVDGEGKVESEGTDGGNLNALQDVTYIFKGNLLGNTDQALTFKAEGFNFFGNSFTGYMDVKSMLQGLESENVDGTVYMWCNDPANTEQYQTYVGTSLHRILSGRGLKAWQKEVAPMQTFILRLRGADSANESVNYAASIWGNPRYGNGGASLAPRRRIAEINEELYLEISVKAANGKGDVMDFTEANANTDAFESGFDVEKYMNQNSINLYATVDGMNLSSVVTNNIAGKTLSLKTNGEIAYTMSFKNVDSNEYAIRDNVTNQVIAIEEGATYEFAAQPNSTIEGRFEIVSRADAPTAIENTEVKANVKGIYTIMGQYLGEDFDILPAGVYVVDGVKIVK
jgi:hypothetical protein